MKEIQQWRKQVLSFKNWHLLYAPFSIAILIGGTIELSQFNLNFLVFYKTLQFFVHAEKLPALPLPYFFYIITDKGMNKSEFSKNYEYLQDINNKSHNLAKKIVAQKSCKLLIPLALCTN